MREVIEVAEKDPGADLRRLSNREKTLPVDRLRVFSRVGVSVFVRFFRFWARACRPGCFIGFEVCRFFRFSCVLGSWL